MTASPCAEHLIINRHSSLSSVVQLDKPERKLSTHHILPLLFSSHLCHFNLSYRCAGTMRRAEQRLVQERMDNCQRLLDLWLPLSLHSLPSDGDVGEADRTAGRLFLLVNATAARRLLASLVELLLASSYWR